MDSDQDISRELDRLNAQLAELAAAEDINISTYGTGAKIHSGRSHEADDVHVLPEQTDHHSHMQCEGCAPAQQQQTASCTQQTQQTISQYPSLIEKAPTRPLGDYARQPLAVQSSAAVASGEGTQLCASTQTSGIPMQANTSLLQQQIMLPSNEQQQSQHGSLLQQLLVQHGKLLDLLQLLARNNNSKDKESRYHQQHIRSTSAVSDGLDVVGRSSYSSVPEDPRYLALQQQSQDQLMDNHLLRKRLNKVQKVLLQHAQEAKLKAAAAEAACQEAHRREQEAVATAAALQTQVAEQQEHLQRQQHELCSLKDQLLQVKELHKQKLAQARADMKQHYEAQLQATTAVYAQELAQIQSHMTVRKQKSHSSKHLLACAPAAEIAASQGCEQPRKTRRPGTAPQVSGGAVRHPGPPVTSAFTNNNLLGASATFNSCMVTAAGDPLSGDAAACSVCPIAAEKSEHGSSKGLHVPAEVVQYAERYQQGGEGACRPPTAPPSVLQRKRHQEQPVPEAAAQLAEHFVTGGEGISRPLTAPSSDRCGLMPRSSSSPAPRSNRPCARTDVMMPAGSCIETAGT